jgi:hypothetical protein
MAKAGKPRNQRVDDPLRQYIILDPATMKTPPGRFMFVPIDTEDHANRMCIAIGLAAYADALKVFGRNRQSMAVVSLAAEMANAVKEKHPELFRGKESKNADFGRARKARSRMG